MSEQDYLVGKCRYCGEELRVPARLDTFSCMFCGAKLTPDDLVEELPAVELNGNADELVDSVKQRIIHCVADFSDMHKMITRKDYDTTFEGYERACRDVFVDLDLACRLDPEGSAQRLEDVVTSFLDQMEQRWAMQPRHQQNAIREGDKITLAVFMVPMVDHLQLSNGKAFCETLQKRWVERYPKSPFYLGTYDAISGGFRKRFRFCFITTAVCEELGKPDDCAELTAFRAFRDGYLSECPDGPALIEEYYNIAPGIVTCINMCGDRHERYAAIREQYLAPCYAALQGGRPEECKQRYTEMVRNLQREYLS